MRIRRFQFEFGSSRIIFSRVAHLGLRKVPLIFSFRSLSPLQIELQCGTYMCHENTQVEFEFGSGQIIFGTVMPLGLRKIPIMGHKSSDMVLFELF